MKCFSKNFLQHTLFGSILLLVLSGCTPHFDLTVTDVPSFEKKIDYMITEVRVFGEAVDLEKKVTTVDLSQMTKKDLPAEFHPALTFCLREALVKSDLFDRSSPKKAILEAQVYEIDVPLMGMDATVRVGINYRIIADQNKDVLFQEKIETQSTTPMWYAFLRRERSHKALTDATIKNMSEFISRLNQSAKASKK